MDLIKELELIEDLSADYQKILSNLYFTHNYLLDQYKQILQAYDLTPQQANVLGGVYHFYPQPLTLARLKSTLLEKNADVSRIVTRLTLKKLLTRVIDKDNRRKVEICITQKGIELLKKLEKEKPFQFYTSDFTLEEAKTFTYLLKKLRK